DLQSNYEKALQWLVKSNIRNPDGTYRSIYNPKTKEYINWYGNKTCLLSTSGAIFVLESAGYEDLALSSAEHICKLVIEHNDGLKGALLSGNGGRYVFANWMSSAVVALLLAYQRSKYDRFLRAAVRATKFIIEKMQN